MSRIEEYINTISIENRDEVLGQIMKCRIIKEALATPVGKALLNSTIDSINIKIGAIVGSCTMDSKKDQVERIQRLALEVHVAFNLMKDWANILVNGKVHEEAMKEK